MPAESLPMSNLKLFDVANDVSLSVSSSVTILLPTASACLLTPRPLLGALLSGVIWTIRAPGCHINFQICMDGHPLERAERQYLLEAIGDYLCNVPMWKYLCLTTSFRIETVLNGKYEILSLQLRRSCSSLASNSIPATETVDVAAPAQIQCAFLDSIDMRLDFSTVPENLQQPNFKRPRQHDLIYSSINEDGIMVSEDFATLMTEDKICSTPGEIISSQLTEVKADTVYPLDLDPQDVGEMIFSDLDKSVSTTSLSSQEIGSPTKRLLPRPVVDASSVMRLTTTALTALIAGKPYRRLSNITINKSPQHTLSSLIPAIFSPGFNRVMAHNVKHLPIISNSAVSWMRNVQGPSLKRKLLCLSEDGNLGDVVQARVWKLIHQGVYEPLAARREFWETVSEKDRALQSLAVEEADEEDLFDDDSEGKEMLFNEDDEDLLDSGEDLEESMLL